MSRSEGVEMEMTAERTVMELIVYSGDARSKAIEAMRKAKNGEMETAKAKIKEADEQLNIAHNHQTKMIQMEAGGEIMDFSLLLVHAQDHLMNAITIRDLAKEIIAIHEKLKEAGL